MACTNPPAAEYFSPAALENMTEKLIQTCLNATVTLEFNGKNHIGIAVDQAPKYFLGYPTLVSELLGVWWVYPAAAILARLIDFKLPLLQLVFQHPRPRLVIGRWSQVLAFLHLVGDPIDSMSSNLFTLVSAMRTLRDVLRKFKERDGLRPTPRARPSLWKMIGAAVYRMLGMQLDSKLRRARMISLVHLTYVSNGHPIELQDVVDCEDVYETEFEHAALSLAADRSSNFLPVGIAVFGFITTVLLKYVYIDSTEYDDNNPQHIVIWSLSSSMIVMCDIPNVILASVIGVQQSPHTGWRILRQLEGAIQKAQKASANRLRSHGSRPASAAANNGAPGVGPPTPMPIETAPTPPPSVIRRISDDNEMLSKSPWNLDQSLAELQLQNGAVSNWRPDQPRARPHWAFPFSGLDLIALLNVVGGSAGAIALAAKVSPEGGNCRTITKVVMVSIYLAKFLAQRYLLNRPESIRRQMYWTMFGDAISLALFTSVICVTQSGGLNRHGCYRLCDTHGLCGIFSPKISWEVVSSRIPSMYASILFGFLAAQLVFCALILLVLKDGCQVYHQDDTPQDEAQDNVSRGDEDTGDTPTQGGQIVEFKPILRLARDERHSQLQPGVLKASMSDELA
ncbi:hypothetical protein GQ53DRAFT_850519 [Thozetella sp. PMI_491]|nr:hypothetical protein GQ53DRAFT_850519 [Thozetella sp. PMI_491]